MKHTVTTWAIISFVTLQSAVSLISMPVSAEDARSRTDDNTRARYSGDQTNDSESSIARASEVYKAIVKESKVPQSVLSAAKCIAVFPEVVTAAVGVGGTHGDGVGFCRTSSGGWSSPVFLNVNGGSLGLQVGVKSADVVLYMTGDKAREAIEKGEFALTGELSAVAGSFDETFNAPRTGVIAYTRTGGVFAGASVGGLNLSRDNDEQRAFYGTSDSSSIFEGKIPPKVANSVKELQSLLPA